MRLEKRLDEPMREDENATLLNAVSAIYKELIKNYKNLIVINGDQEIKKVHEDIIVGFKRLMQESAHM